MNILFILLAYLLGSIPFGLILTKLRGKDIREIGSSNIGATNVLRTGHKGLAALTLILDLLKGIVAVFISFYSGAGLIMLASALAAVLGHMYPVWLKFKGGKGVATALGAITALMPPLGFAMIALWFLTAAIMRISSLAALVAFAAAPLLSWFWIGDQNLALLTGIIALLIFWQHRENIRRIRSGEEPKINFKISSS